MPKFFISSVIPAPPAEVYQHVTGFPISGRLDINLIDKQYGTLVDSSGQQYTFKDHSPAEVIWKCDVSPPNYRRLVALDSSWSDRIDTFVKAGNYTLWRIDWMPKRQGKAVYTQWLMFQLKVKRDAYRNIIMPVLSHFDNNISGKS